MSAKDWMMPLTFLLVFPMMISFDLRQIVQPGSLKLQLVAQGLNFLVFPFLAFLLGLLVFPDNVALRTGLLLSALLPTSGMTVTWTGLAKGPVPLAVQLVLVGLVAGTLATPLYLKGLLGTAIDLSLLDMAVQIAMIVILPLLAGAALRGILIRVKGQQVFDAELKPLFPGLSTVAVLLVVFSALALRAPVTLVARRFFARGQAIALVYGTVLRNLSIALALVMSLLGTEGAGAALVITWAYVVQVQGAAWYQKVADRLLKAPVDQAGQPCGCPGCPACS